MKFGKKQVIILSIMTIVGLTYWIVDSFVGYIFSGDGLSFLQHLFPDHCTYRMVMRALVIFILISIGAFMSFMCALKDREKFLSIQFAEEKIQETEDLKNRILDSIGDFVCIIDKDGVISYANAASFFALGSNPSVMQTEGFTLDKLMSKKDLEIALSRMRYAIANPDKKLPVQQYTLRYESDRLREVPVEVHTTIIEDDGEIKILAVARDVSERITLDEERQKLEKLHSIGTLAGGIAHDFNNILTRIKGAISICLRLIDESDDCYDHLAGTKNAIDRAEGLTHQLLTFAKGGDPRKENCSVLDIIAKTVNFSIGNSSRSKCCVDIPSDTWMIYADFMQMCQIFQNLVINADHAMPTGGIINVFARNRTVRSVSEGGLSDGDYVEISVRDEGVGIPKEYIDKIFDPYFSTKSADGKGTGLGLSVVHSIIDRHGGHVSVNSVPGKGTEFVFLIPAVRMTEVMKEEVESVPSVKREKLRILVMDDEEIVYVVLDEILKQLGHSATIVENGEDAISSFKKSIETDCPFDLVMLDLTIPGGGKSGEEVLVEIKEIDPDARCIGMSGYSDSGNIDGFDSFIGKPFDITNIEKAIENSFS